MYSPTPTAWWTAPHTVPAYQANYDDSLWTLPQAVKKQGYTMAYYGKRHIERTNDLTHFGFGDQTKFL